MPSFIPIPRNAHLWFPAYWRWRRSRPTAPATRLWIAIADHFEPYWNHADDRTARARVAVWRERWPQIAARYSDTVGNPPRYTFFYPQEQYTPEAIDPLVEMTQQGIADVEVHIHHDGEGQRDFLDRMGGFIDVLSARHGLLHRDAKGLRFGFIHGNWALDNSRPDGRYCGLNNEITLLRDLGCYADFTMPAVPEPSQGGPVNEIYGATDDPTRPRSYESGRPVRRGENFRGDLLMVPGPLNLNWRDRPLWKPRIETGELASNDRVRSERFALWMEAAPRIGGDAFLKLYTHGAPERNATCLLGEDLDKLCCGIIEACRQCGTELRFATTWEMYGAIETALRG